MEEGKEMQKEDTREEWKIEKTSSMRKEERGKHKAYVEERRRENLQKEEAASRETDTGRRNGKEKEGIRVDDRRQTGCSQFSHLSQHIKGNQETANSENAHKRKHKQYIYKI